MTAPVRLAMVAALALMALPAAARPIGAPGGSGPHPAIAEALDDAPGHTLYRPEHLPGKRLPLVLWGNGGCRDNGLSASHFLREIASHGYVVIANGRPRAESPVAERLPEPPPLGSAPPPQRATPDETGNGERIAWRRRGIRRHAAILMRSPACAASPRGWWCSTTSGPPWPG